MTKYEKTRLYYLYLVHHLAFNDSKDLRYVENKRHKELVDFALRGLKEKNIKVIDLYSKPYKASCFITEVMNRGMKDKVDYLHAIIVDHEFKEDYLVIKLEDQYYKFSTKTSQFEKTEPKTKEVIYFE